VDKLISSLEVIETASPCCSDQKDITGYWSTSRETTCITLCSAVHRRPCSCHAAVITNFSTCLKSMWVTSGDLQGWGLRALVLSSVVHIPIHNIHCCRKRTTGIGHPSQRPIVDHPSWRRATTCTGAGFGCVLGPQGTVWADHVDHSNIGWEVLAQSFLDQFLTVSHTSTNLQAVLVKIAKFALSSSIFTVPNFH
jgi:hypothetical protein